MTTLPLDKTALLKRLKKEQKFKVVKPIVTAPTLLEKIFHKSRQPRSVYYFTTGRSINDHTIQELEKTKTSYSLPTVLSQGVPFSVFKQEERRKKRDSEKSMTVFEKPSRKTRLMEHFAERVHVPPNEKLKVSRDNVVVDEQYFAVIRGRPIKEKFSVRNYVNEVRQTLFTKLRTGFLQDEVYLIDEQHHNEKNTIRDLTELLKDYHTSFKEFQAQDHEEWLTIRRRADQMASETREKSLELKSLMKELNQITCSLYILEETWRNCKLCQIVLFLISPHSWQVKHPLKDQNKEEITDINNMFARYRLDPEGSVQTLNDLIRIFNEDIAAEEGNPELYFTDPWQVRLVFREMELQHLSSLQVIENIGKPKIVLVQGLYDVNTYFDDEIKVLEEQLDSIEKQIQIEEEKASKLELKANDLLNNDLKDLVSSESIILTHVFVEHAYEECVASGDIDMTTLETLQAIKVMYEDLMLKLDSLPSDIVKEATSIVQTKNALSMEKAHRSRRQIAILDNLTRSMKRALDKPFIHQGRPLMWRSKPSSPRQKQKQISEKYSRKELEYLIHFTDYCKYDDDEAVKLYFPLGT